MTKADILTLVIIIVTQGFTFWQGVRAGKTLRNKEIAKEKKGLREGDLVKECVHVSAAMLNPIPSRWHVSEEELNMYAGK
jgi:hypothetical protein